MQSLVSLGIEPCLSAEELPPPDAAAGQPPSTTQASCDAPARGSDSSCSRESSQGHASCKRGGKDSMFPSAQFARAKGCQSTARSAATLAIAPRFSWPSGAAFTEHGSPLCTLNDLAPAGKISGRARDFPNFHARGSNCATAAAAAPPVRQLGVACVQDEFSSAADGARVLLQANDVLPAVLFKTQQRDVGAVMLTCKRWHDEMKALLHAHPNHWQTWNPASETVFLKDAQVTARLAKLPGCIEVNAGARDVRTVGQVTQLRFPDEFAWSPGGLAHVIGQFRALCKLDLARQDFAEAGAPAVAAPLGALVSLTHLDLGENSWRAKGIAELAPALGSLANLRVLKLGANDMGPEGAAALSAALSELLSLTSLVLDDNELGVAGVQALTRALRNLPNLVSLYLSRNDLGNGGARALVEDWERPQRLRYLWCVSNGVSDMGKLSVPMTWSGKVTVFWHLCEGHAEARSAGKQGW